MLRWQDDVCHIEEVPFRGVNCSDAAGKQINYSAIVHLLPNSTSGKKVDPDTMSPYLNYVVNIPIIKSFCLFFTLCILWNKFFIH